jgi:hypothetical protein
MSKPLNVYKVYDTFDDGFDVNEYVMAIVRAEDEEDAIQMLVEDDYDDKRRSTWATVNIQLIGWATGEDMKGVICIFDV